MRDHATGRRTASFWHMSSEKKNGCMKLVMQIKTLTTELLKAFRYTIGRAVVKVGSSCAHHARVWKWRASLLYCEPWHQTEVSGQLHDRAALASAQEPSILFEYEVTLTPGLFGEEKSLWALPGIKPRFLLRPVHNIVATVITLGS
jgi:hypothetical protein